MGLPGSGKTTLSDKLEESLTGQGFTISRFNADKVRKVYDDWDFSEAGRIRQSERMRRFADKSMADVVLCDFIAPLPVMREKFDADLTVWVDTVTECKYDDTNKMFAAPDKYDFRVTEKDADKWSKVITSAIKRRIRR